MAQDSSRKPWMKFYTSDWRADPGLRMCSYAARGLWADMLTLMHEAEPYGHLVVSGASPTAKDLANLLGGNEKEVASLLAVLESKRVFSRTDQGVIFSRRMLRDEAKERLNKDNGGKGGNPALRLVPKPKVNEGVNPPLNQVAVEADNGDDKAQIPEARDQIPDKKEKVSVASQPRGSNDLDDAVSAWNEMAEANGLSRVSRLTEPRKAKLRQRLLDCGGLDGWHDAMHLVPKSPFLLGQSGEWKASFDFVLQASSFTKLMEGTYSNRGSKQQPSKLGWAFEAAAEMNQWPI